MMADGTAQPHRDGKRRPVRTALRRSALCARQACGTDRNPLCRRSDRTRARLLVLLVTLLLLAPLPALLIGGLAYQQGRHTAEVQLAQRRQVAAVTLASAPKGQARIGQQSEVPVAARWSLPPGHSHTGQVLVAPGTAAGARVPLWVDASGQPARAPRSSADITADAWFAAAGTLAAIASFAVTGVALTRRSLDRRDDLAWTRQWAEVEPEWSGRRPHGIDGR